MINQTQQNCIEQQYRKESGEMIQVKNILKTYDHSKQAFIQYPNINIGTKIRLMKYQNSTHLNNNQSPSYTQNAVRYADMKKLKIPEQNNFNYENFENRTKNKKYIEQNCNQISKDIQSKKQTELNYNQIFPELFNDQEIQNKKVELDNNKFNNISKLTNNKQKTLPGQSLKGNLQQRIRTYSQETLKNNRVKFQLPDVEDYKVLNLQYEKPNDFLRLKPQSKRSSLAENSSNSPSKVINFNQYYKTDKKMDSQGYKKRIEQMDKNWQKLLQENDFI